MTAGEDQPQPVIRQEWLVDLADRGVAVVDANPLEALQLLLLGNEDAFTTQPVDRPVASHPRDPGAGIVRKPVGGPALESDDERLLDRLLSRVEVAEDANQGRDRAPGFVPENAVDDLFAGPYAATFAAGVELW